MINVMKSLRRQHRKEMNGRRNFFERRFKCFEERGDEQHKGFNVYSATKRCQQEYVKKRIPRAAKRKVVAANDERALIRDSKKMFTTDYEARLYEQLLDTAGISQQLCTATQESQKAQTLCCTDNPNDIYIRNGYYTCWICGLVSTNAPEYIHHEPYTKPGEPLGAGSGVTFQRKRSYKSLTHFKEHLRRYMGARNGLYDVDVIDMLRTKIDVADPECYRSVQKVLKQHGHKTMYKEIFTLIYMLGGERPNIDNKVFDACVTDFLWLQARFVQMKKIEGTKRKNMPSMYVLLDLLLRRNKHVPYYKLPYLKDTELQSKVMVLFEELDGKHQLMRDVDIDVYIDEQLNILT